MNGKKKLELEILDPTGTVVRKYHLKYDAGTHNRLRITIDGETFFWEGLPPRRKIDDEEWATEYKGVHQPVVDNTSTPPTKEPVYQDPKTENPNVDLDSTGKKS